MIGEQLAGRSRLRIPVAAETEIYKGDFVAINADGYAVKVSKTEGLLNAGVAVSDANNVTGDAGDLYVEAERGAVIYANAGDIKETDLLKKCYFAGEDSVTLVSDGSSEAGVIIMVEDDTVAVDML